jgi:hypothetical protein
MSNNLKATQGGKTMSILETLWSGRYYPAEKGIPKDGEYKELFDAATKKPCSFNGYRVFPFL